MKRAIQISALLIFLNIGSLLFIELSHDWRAYLTLSAIVVILFFVITIYIEYGRRSFSKKFFTGKYREKVKDNQGNHDSKPDNDGISFESKYRERNSGMTWNRESLHSANSTRGSYRKFLRSFKKR